MDIANKSTGNYEVAEEFWEEYRKNKKQPLLPSAGNQVNY